jgi:hypothetical protein
MLPRLLVAGRTRACEREVFEVKGRKIPLELSGLDVFSALAGKRALRACLERPLEAVRGHPPPPGLCPAIQALDEFRVNQHASRLRVLPFGRHKFLGNGRVLAREYTS